MPACGIICEYNPIHNGHARLIEAARRLGGGDIICVMSGNFVQRGEAAVFPKRVRAECALEAGADLVLELPITAALSSAEGFARGGVATLDALGVCGSIAFGSECGDVSALSAAARALLSPELDADIKARLSTGVSYAAARERALREAIGEGADVLRAPNDILAVEYIKALLSLGSALQPIAVKREGGGHDGADGLSSSALREALRRGEPVWGAMPEACAEVLKRAVRHGLGPVWADDSAALSRLRFLPESAFLSLPGATEGLGERLYRYAQTEPGMSAIADAAKTKRYAHSRIRRMLMCAVLGITAADVALPPQYIRVLAANGRGRSLLREISKTCSLPVITKPASAKKLTAEARRVFDLTAAATDFYALSYTTPEPRRGGSEWRDGAIITE